jgi:hypothetical protein
MTNLSMSHTPTNDSLAIEGVAIEATHAYGVRLLRIYMKNSVSFPLINSLHTGAIIKKYAVQKWSLRLGSGLCFVLTRMALD